MMISEADEAQKFLAYLKTLTPEQRVLAFQFIEQDICRHCGDEQAHLGACVCMKDE